MSLSVSVEVIEWVVESDPVSSLAFFRYPGPYVSCVIIILSLVDSPHKGPVMQTVFPCAFFSGCTAYLRFCFLHAKLDLSGQQCRYLDPYMLISNIFHQKKIQSLVNTLDNAGQNHKKSRLKLGMTPPTNGNIFCVIGPLRGESTGERWIPLTKASDMELRGPSQ